MIYYSEINTSLQASGIILHGEIYYVRYLEILKICYKIYNFKSYELL